MIIKTFPLGMIRANAYLAIDEKTKEAIVIDIGGDFSVIKKELEDQKAKLKYIFNTHGHFDHIFGEHEAQKYTDSPVFINEYDKVLAENLPKQLEMFGFVDNMQAPTNLKTFKDGDIFKIGEIEIKVIHTPGHTPGSVCFLVENNLFSGDTLFYSSIGRTDFEGGSFSQISDSIKNKLFTLPEETVVFPGHDTKTTIGYEKKYNCYFGSEI